MKNSDNSDDDKMKIIMINIKGFNYIYFIFTLTIFVPS